MNPNHAKNNNPTIILIHGISDQPDDWYSAPSKHLSNFGKVIAFRWDDILNTNLKNPIFPFASKASKLASFFFPKWKIADITMRWVLDRGADLLGYAKVREQAFQRLDTMLEAIDGDVYIVAHSLGSVMAFEYLAVSPHENVVKLITLGSPLDRQPVKGRVFERSPRKALDIDWLNVYGTLDPVVCWLPLLKNNGAMQEFKPSEQRKLLGRGHDLEGYVLSLTQEDFR
jgi:predicted alpha/beta hydrolase family esterase